MEERATTIRPHEGTQVMRLQLVTPEPVDPATGLPYFTVPVESWGVGWKSGTVLHARSELFFGGPLDRSTLYVGVTMNEVQAVDPTTGGQVRYRRHQTTHVHGTIGVSFFALDSLSKEELESAAHVAVHKVLY